MVYNSKEGGAEMAYNVSDIQTMLTPVFDDYGISRAVLFGSAAKGTATEKSDLDLLVDRKLHGLKSPAKEFLNALAQRNRPQCGIILSTG